MTDIEKILVVLKTIIALPPVWAIIIGFILSYYMERKPRYIK